MSNVTVEDLQAKLGFADKTTGPGLKGRIDEVDVDIWPLDKIWAFSKLDLVGRKPTFDDLVLTTPFNLEAVAVGRVSRP